MTTTTPKIQISTTLFWKMYNTLLGVEATLSNISDVWDKDSEQGMDIASAHADVATIIGKLETTINSLKDIDARSN